MMKANQPTAAAGCPDCMRDHKMSAADERERGKEREGGIIDLDWATDLSLMTCFSLHRARRRLLTLFRWQREQMERERVLNVEHIIPH